MKRRFLAFLLSLSLLAMALVPAWSTFANETEVTPAPAVETSSSQQSEEKQETKEEEKVTPTEKPTEAPTAGPTETPTAEPTATPTAEPTATPTAEPTATPTAEPTETPTAEPTATPTAEPTEEPTPVPEVDELVVSVKADQASAFAGQIISATVTISGGLAPYSVKATLTNGDGSTAVNETVLETAGSTSISATAIYGTATFTVSVTDALNNTASDSAQSRIATYDRESAAKWESTFENVELTGDWREDVLAIARTQIGYHESTSDFIIDAEGNMKGYTRYGDWYGVEHEDWCAMFVAFCLNYADVSRSDYPWDAGCEAFRNNVRSFGAYVSAGDYDPQPGDLIFFEDDEYRNQAGHIGVVERVSDTTVYTIEGNSASEVRCKSYSLNDSNIMGYSNTTALMIRAGVLDVEPEETVEPEKTEEPVETKTPVVTEAPTATPAPVINEGGTVLTTPTPVPATGEKKLYESTQQATLSGSADAVQSVTLPQFGMVELSASGSGSAQWQIQVPGTQLWVNIAGETSSTIALTYAKISSMLSGGAANLRCAFGSTYSATARVTVSYGAAETEAEAEVEAPAVQAFTTFALQRPSSSVSTYNVSAQNGEDTPSEDPPTTPTTSTKPTTYNVVINYVSENNDIVADPYTASLAKGSDFSATVTFPTVQGYLPYLNEVQQNSIDLNYAAIDKDYTFNVVYKPTNVNYTVIHYQQNLDNDNYTEVARETKQGLTNSTVPDVAKTYEGFYALLYEKPTIAADGSTVVEVYYDRYYYLMNFDLDGGYDVEPIYARYGAPISVDTPTKPGYTFESWTPAIPSTMPADNTSYKASWKIGTSGFTVVFWYENADDDGYSVAGTYTPADVKPGTEKKSEDYKNQSFTGRDDKHFTYNAAKAETVTVKGDGSTVLNVYYTRNTYTLTFKDGQKTLTCTKTEHTHSDSCCKYGGTGFLHWWHDKNCCKLGLSEHSHSNSCYKTSDLTITAKYQADIHGNFPIMEGNKTIWWNVPNGCNSFKPGTQLGSIDTMPGENITFTSAGADSGAVLLYYVETLNGESGEYTHDGKNFKIYKRIDIEQSGWLTYTEEFHNITGFTQWWSDPAFDKMEQGGITTGVKENNYLCYTRNSYKLEFYNYNAYVTGKDGSVQYEAPLSNYNFTPEYPAKLEPNAYEFDGWYTTAGCYEGSKADLSTMTMPASDVILYAKWVPVSHKVEFYLDKAAMEAGTKLSTHPDITVSHGSMAKPTPEDPTNGSYTFVGWFYVENGVEKAFDFANMPVKKDLQVYGKWSSNVLKQYTIYYKIQGTDTKIADSTTGSGLAGVTKTFEAKGGTELYAGYQEGYFPVTKSHSMTLDINATEENDTNVYTFWYVQKQAVPYTVKYLNKETGEPVATEKTVSDNRKAVVTETFVPVTGMMPDAYQKRLVVSAEEGAVNEIIFYYTEDTTHAYYKITHYTENLAKDAQGKPTWTEYASSQAVGDINKEYTATPMTIPGFTFDSTVQGTVISGELTADGLELKLYYTRNSYPYQVRYLEQGSGKVLATPKDGTGKYGQVISESAIDIPNYTAVDPTSQTLNIRIEESQTEAKLNIITFYYTENEATINYVAVGPDNLALTDGSIGSVSPTSESVKVLTGTAQGSTATLNGAPTYKFVGWYSDASCAADKRVSTDATYVPQQPGRTTDTSGTITYGLWPETTTYYAKFDWNVSTLTITKSGMDSNESAIFQVKAKTADNQEKTFTVAVKNGQPVTISDLIIGSNYSVTEVGSWTWRYDPIAKVEGTIQASGSEVSIQNTNKPEKWLYDEDVKHNKFGTTSASAQ